MLLEAKNLTAGYRRPVVRGASLALGAGTVTALLGPNGCGKSTLLRALSGNGRVFGGSVRVLGQDCLALPARRRARCLALLPQPHRPAAGPDRAEVIAMGRYAYSGPFGGPAPGDAERVEQAARALGVQDLLDADCAALSEGQRQLVHLGRVVAQNAPVLLLDEPNSALDYTHTHRLFAALRRWAQGGQRAALVVLHDPALALRYADRLLLMQAARCAAAFAPAAGLPPRRRRCGGCTRGCASCRGRTARCFARRGSGNDPAPLCQNSAFFAL